MVVAYESLILPKGTIDPIEAVMQRNDEDTLARIAGVIVPADWDRQGNVTGVSISTFDEEEYLVQEQAKGAELIQHLRKDAEVVGWVEVERGKKKITVKHYRLRRYRTGGVR
jgi:hypothetical protein